eukprot:jgi/Mesvir1/20586/Mv14824-RA.1
MSQEGDDIGEMTPRTDAQEGDDQEAATAPSDAELLDIQNAAATRIQSVQRGRMAKQRVARIREARDGDPGLTIEALERVAEEQAREIEEGQEGDGERQDAEDAPGDGSETNDAPATQRSEGSRPISRQDPGQRDPSPSQATPIGDDTPEAASANPTPKDAARVTLELVINPEGFKHNLDMDARDTVGSVKNRASEQLHMPLKTIRLRYQGFGWLLDDSQTLSALGIIAGQHVTMELAVHYDGSTTGSFSAQDRQGQVLDVLLVNIPGAIGEDNSVIRVRIDRSQRAAPPFLGGYRNKKTGVEYHHCSVQTESSKNKRTAESGTAGEEAAAPPSVKLTRETQTFIVSTRTVQTFRESSTQMVRPDILLDSGGDREVTPGVYVDSEEWHHRRVMATIVIQCHARGWQARKLAAELRERKREGEEFRYQEEMRRLEAEEKHRMAEIQRRMRPRTKADFEILYNELEAWRLQETRKIKMAGMDPEKRHAALKALLDKETKLLQTIDRLKISASKENKEGRVAASLADMSSAKRWEMREGGVAEVHTPFTTRAQELTQLYKGLKLPLLSTDERLDVLLHVKWTIKEFDCNLTRELAELVDREADLLHRGRPVKSLEGLRKRICNLFLQFVETPEFNPEAARFQITTSTFDTTMTQAPTRRNTQLMRA